MGILIKNLPTKFQNSRFSLNMSKINAEDYFYPLYILKFTPPHPSEKNSSAANRHYITVKIPPTTPTQSSLVNKYNFLIE